MYSHFNKCSPQCFDSEKSVILFKVMMQFNVRERVREGESNKTKCNVNRIYLICQHFCMIQVRCIFTCSGVLLNTEGNISPKDPLLTILRPLHLFILSTKSNVHFGTLTFISFVQTNADAFGNPQGLGLELRRDATPLLAKWPKCIHLGNLPKLTRSDTLRYSSTIIGKLYHDAVFWADALHVLIQLPLMHRADPAIARKSHSRSIWKSNSYNRQK